MKKNFILAVIVILLIVMTSILFVACMPENDAADEDSELDIFKLITKLEENGYMVEAWIPEENDIVAEDEGFGEGVIQMLYADNEDDEYSHPFDTFVEVAWYKDVASAKTGYNNVKNDPEIIQGGCKVVRKGHAVAYGFGKIMDFLNDKSLYTDKLIILSGNVADDDNNESTEEIKPLDIVTIKTELQNNGYKVIITPVSSSDEDEYGEGVTTVLIAEKGMFDALSVVWYNSDKSAKLMFDKLINEDMIGSGYKAALKNNVIVCGTPENIKSLLGDNVILYPENDSSNSDDDSNNDNSESVEGAYNIPQDVDAMGSILKQYDFDVDYVLGKSATDFVSSQYNVDGCLGMIIAKGYDDNENESVITLWFENTERLEEFYNFFIEELERQENLTIEIDFIKLDNTIAYGSKNIIDILRGELENQEHLSAKLD